MCRLQLFTKDEKKKTFSFSDFESVQSYKRVLLYLQSRHLFQVQRTRI